MLRNFNSLGAGPSQTANTVTITTSNQNHTQPPPSMSFPPTEPPVNLASKVAEVFLTAGHAFQKLGDLTLQLHSNVEPEECKWTEKDVDQLRDSLTRFAHELDMISQSVQGRTSKHIKTDIKRRHLIPEEARRPSSPGIKRSATMVPSGMITKRIPVVPASKPIPIPNRTMVPSQQRVTVTHGPQMNQPLLNEPSHHYINTG
ncbi:unnamed protein product [Auanema sp. JU1783]|nr:unnamed protein product [Auanema sp. JU1783]